VLVEAMASGLPVVTTNVGGIPELISDECVGIASPVDVDSFHSSIVSLLTDAGRRERMAHLAFERVATRFSDAVFNEKVKSLYLSLL
jgi:glycosyltransferase involved in cell wall biosynthesis